MYAILNSEVARNPNNEALKAFQKRFINDEHPLSFTEEAWKDYQKGVSAYDKGDYANAIKNLKKSLEKDKYSHGSWFYLARANFKRGGRKDYNLIVKQAKEFLPDKNF